MPTPMRIKKFVLKLWPGTWSINAFLDLRLALWPLGLGTIGALASLWFGVKFAIAGAVIALSGIGLIFAVMACAAIRAYNTWLSEILRHKQGEQPAQSRPSAASSWPN